MNGALLAVYILDAEPKQAARYLTKRHIKNYIRNIEETFILYNKQVAYSEISSSIELKHKELRHKELRQFIKNREHCAWLVAFYKEMQEIYKKYISLDNTYFNERDFDRDILEDHVIYDTILLKSEDLPDFSTIKQTMIKYNSEINLCEDKIQLNKVLYILTGFRADQFPKGFPFWYLLSETIYKSYNIKNKVSVKIDLIKGEFKYFHRVHKGEWKEIKDVPSNMAMIINSFLFPIP